MKFSKSTLEKRVPILIFSLCLVSFILLKIPHLSLPFFWDESGVYGKMIYHLADVGLSLHPESIDQWISRGHPLLYPNIIAFFCRLFGTNVTVAHIVNFTLACLLLVSIFICLNKIFNSWIGFISCVLLMVQPIFYTQSVFVLPEIALTFFLWWTTWFFIEKRYFLYFLSGTAAVLIKEPAIVWIGSLMLWEIIKNRKSISWKMLLWLSPLVPFCIFLYVQKLTFGWYFFPYHTNGFDLKIGHLTGKLTDYLEFLLWKQGRLIWLLIILMVLFNILFKKLNKNNLEKNPIVNDRIQAGIVSCAMYILFSSTTFFGERYVLPVLPVLTTLIAVLLYNFIFKNQYVLIVLFLSCMTVVSFLHMNSATFNYDNDMSYIRSINSSKKTIQYMLNRKMLIQDQFSATMPLIFALSDARFGYLPSDTLARHSRALHEGSKYAVQVIPGTPIENPENRPLELLDEWYDRDIITRIYLVMPLDSATINK